MTSRCKNLLGRIRKLGNPANVEGMARFGINTARAYGVSIPTLRKLAKETGRDHELAMELWRSGVHEARILAAYIADPRVLTEEQMESWVLDFDSWDICDQVCSSLFDRTALAHTKAVEWAGREKEFVKRAGFALMAALAVHDKSAPDSAFRGFLAEIKRASADERNYVRKAVNWALRQIGKRNASLNRHAVKAAEDILKIDSKAARWVARDALRELTSEKVRARISRQRG
jgi:3-methyladenine DNA glycosylase AlkD